MVETAFPLVKKKTNPQGVSGKTSRDVLCFERSGWESWVRPFFCPQPSYAS